MIYRKFLLVVVFSLASAACSHAPLTLAPEQQRLLSSHSPLLSADRGLVYDGQVYTLDGEYVFRYQRVVTKKGAHLESSHITYDLINQAVVIQTALHTSDYRLLEFVSIDRLTGVSGSMKSDGKGTQVYEVKHGDTKKIKKSSQKHPLVAGPTLFGFILKHWDALVGGETIPVDFVLVDRGESMSFEISHDRDEDNLTTFIMKASNPLVRLFIDPMRVVYNTQTHTPIRYIGRVPPVLEKDGKQITFDARVEYSYPTTKYQ